MTPLRQRMLDDMQLEGYSPRTQEAYVNAVRQLAAHFRRSPEHLSEDDVRDYFLFLAREKKVARATATIAICGIKFLFQTTLQREWTAQHVLPRGFTKVRHYGPYSPTRKADLDRARALIAGAPSPSASPVATVAQSRDVPASERVSATPARRCPTCSTGMLRVIQSLPRTTTRGPA